MPGDFEDEYFPLDIYTIRAGTISPFSINTRSTDTYKEVFKPGNEIDGDKLRWLIGKNVRTVYILKSEADLYNEYLVDNLDSILRDKAIPLGERSDIAHHSIINVADIVFEEPTIKKVRRYKSSIAALTDFIFNDDEALDNLIRLSEHEYQNSIHNVNIGVLATGLAKSVFGLDSDHNMHEIAAGFFLHDIGIINIPLPILYATRRLTHEEWKIIRQHPSEGYKILSKLNLGTRECKLIILQHHERLNGKGYPFGLKEDEIHIYGRMCSLADIFEALTSERPYRPTGKKYSSSFEALQFMKNELAEELDPELFKKFVLMLHRAYYNR